MPSSFSPQRESPVQYDRSRPPSRNSVGSTVRPISFGNGSRRIELRSPDERPFAFVRSIGNEGRKEGKSSPIQQPLKGAFSTPTRYEANTIRKDTATRAIHRPIISTDVSRNPSKHNGDGLGAGASGSWGTFGDNDEDTLLDFEKSALNPQKVSAEGGKDDKTPEPKMTASPDATYPDKTENTSHTNVSKVAQTSETREVTSNGTLGTGMEQLEYWAEAQSKPRNRTLRNERQAMPPETPATPPDSGSQNAFRALYSSVGQAENKNSADREMEKTKWEIETLSAKTPKDSTPKPLIAAQVDAPERSAKSRERVKYDFADGA